MKLKHSSDQGIYHSTTWRYLLAILIIALLSTSAYYTLQSALSDSEATAYIVNLSGRQRMLSQHVALDAHRFHQAKLAESPLPPEAISLMKQNIIDMRTANRQLSSGILSDSMTVDLSIPMREMYFGEMNLYGRVNRYLDIAQKIQSITDNDARRTYLKRIDSVSEQLLQDLNTVVKQYQVEGEQRLEKIEDLELIVWIATLVALLLEVLLIFRPMVAIVVSAQKAQARTLENLEEMVELRTIKLEIANKKLKEIATIDPLTKLKNRLTLETDVEGLIEASEKNHVPFALSIIDVDWFKEVNDTFGHPAGDYVLKELATLMTAIIREYDHLYRAGGEEFVLVLNRVKHSEALFILEKLRKTIAQHNFNFEGSPINITVSVGLYHSSQSDLGRVQDIVRVADHALYIAKNSGRNRIQSVKPDEVRQTA